MRTIIVGGPKTGKTTLAPDAIHTDNLTGDFSTQSAQAALQCGQPGEWTMEGVTTVRALRKWMRDNSGKPCDRIVQMWEAKVPLSDGQARLAKGCRTVWQEVEPELRKRGVIIQ